MPAPKDNETLRVLIVEDHLLFADAVRDTLQDHGMKVVGVTWRQNEALDLLTQEDPHVVLLDLNLPDGSGIEVGRESARLKPEAKLIAVTSMVDGRSVSSAMEAGFHGYLTKDTPLEEFVHAIHRVVEGETITPPDGSTAPPPPSPEEKASDLMVRQLTKREREVLELLTEGASSDGIATQLGISSYTVRTHIQSILTKLQVKSRLAAATFAVKHGLVPQPKKRRRSHQATD